jgi:translation initiation factor 1
MKDERPTVYSTDWENQPVCPRCGKRPCVCKQAVSLPAREQTAHIRRETKGRGGKSVVTVSNLVLSDKDLKSLAKLLKKACGSGGTVKDGIIEIQGEHRDKIAETLEKRGYKVKYTGG